jgi:hypothetical protein
MKLGQDIYPLNQDTFLLSKAWSVATQAFLKRVHALRHGMVAINRATKIC